MSVAHAWLLALALAGAATPGDVRIDDVHVYPESLSADRAGRLYIGSVKGIVYRTAPGGDRAETWIRNDPATDILSILGVLVDEPGRTLWLCSAPMPFRTPPAVGVSALMAFDLATGAHKASYPLPPPAAACNDITIGPDRRVYATDIANGRLFVLRPGDRALALFAEDKRLVGVDGIAFAGDGRLYVNNVRTNQMLRIDRQPDGSYRGLTTLTLSQPIKGPDGLRLIAGDRFLQAEGGSGRATMVTISGDRAEIAVLRDGLESPAGITPAPGARAYAAEGKIGYLVSPQLKGKEPGAFIARAIDLPR